MELVMFDIIAKNGGNQRERQLLKRNIAKHKLLAAESVVQDIVNYDNIMLKQKGNNH